jgi:hypothetical protein
MKQPISVNTKSIGRPKKKGGVYPVSAVRLPPEISAGVDVWAAKQSDKPGRSEAIRRLVELGLTVGTRDSPSERLSAARAARAKDLAAYAIGKMIDPAAPPEEQARRRRRLTKGPLEFRDDRVDMPKAKGK